jgi:exonuclease SbcC
VIPERLVLENFLSYRGETQIDFSKIRSVVIIGENGAGKSSILDGITYALFGVARGTSRSGDNSDRLISSGEKYLKVDFVFLADGIKFNVIRKRDKIRQITELELYKEENREWKNITKSTIKTTQDLINSILKVNYDLFVSSVMIMQGKADSFTRKDPSERKELLYDILELEIYEKLREVASNKRKTIIARVESLKTLIESLKGKIELKNSLEEELKKLYVDINKKEEEIATIKAKFQDISNELERVEREKIKKNNLIERLEREEESLKTFLEEKEKYITQIKEAQQVILMQNEIETNYQRLVSYIEREKKMGEIFENRVRLEREIDTLRKKLSDEEHSLLLQQAELEKEKSIYMAEKDKFMSINLKIQSLQSELKELDRIRAKKTEAEKALNDIIAEITSTGLELSNLRNNLQDSKIKRKNVEERLEYLGKLLREEQSLNEELKLIKENKAKLEILNTDLLNESNRIASLKSQIEEAEKIISSVNESLAILTKKDGETKRCPVCGSNLSEEKRTDLILSYRREIQQKNEFIEATKKRIELGEKSISEKEILREGLKKSIQLEAEMLERKASLINARDQVRSLNDELLGIKTAESHYQSDITGLENRLIELRSRKTTFEKQHNEYLYKLSNESGLLTSLGELQAQLSKIREAERELPKIAKDLLEISRKLETKDYAHETREKVEELEKRLFNIHYDPLLHQELKKNIENFQYIEKEKKLLDEKINEKEILTTAVNSLNERIEIAKKEINRLNKELDIIKVDESELKAISQLKERLSEELDRLTKEREELIKIQASQESTFSNLKAIEEEYLREITELSNLEKEDGLLRMAIDIYGKNGIPAFIIENTLPEIEEKANQILDIISDGRLQVYFRVESKTKKGEFKETLDIEISNEGEVRAYELFSGGEKFKVDIAIRIALSYILANKSGARLSMLVIDEGFGTQDKEGIIKFVECINRISNEFEKLIVITHMDELKDYFETHMRVVKENGASKILFEA